MDERRLELKVGALVAAALVGLVALAWLMGELSLTRGASFSVELSHTGNVAQGAPVKLGGVEVGRVEDIHLQPEKRDGEGEPLPVRMDVEVRDEVFKTLKQDAQVFVATRGPLGEAYLEVHPGSTGAPPLERGAVLRAREALRLEEIASKFGKIFDSAAKMLEDNPEALAQLLTGMSKLSNGLGDVLTDNRAELKTLTGELTAASKDFRALAHAAREQLEPGGKTAELIDDAAASAKVLRRDLPQLSANATKTLAGLSAVTSQLTPEDGQRLKVAIEKYSAAGEKLDHIAARAERILARIEAGEGTLGGLAKDDQLYKDLKALIADLREHPWKVIWRK